MQTNYPIPKKFFSIEDIRFVALLPLLSLSTCLISESGWYYISRKISRYCGSLLSRSPVDIQKRILDVAGKFELPDNPVDISNSLVANEIETKFQLMASQIPNRWRPNIKLFGEENIKAGLIKGKGVILWDSHFSFSSTITKMGLHSAGYSLHHLSRKEHGFSSTLFGIKYLNPIRTSVESRYLADRIVIRSDNPGSVINTLAKRLKNNAVVSITVRGTANRPVRGSFLDDSLRVAPGAVVLALKTGAQLIPVFTIKHNDKDYRVNLGPSIKIPRHLSREEAVKETVCLYLNQLEPYVLKYPGQWIDWINI